MAAYLIVDARRRVNTDARNATPGIWDEGIEILSIDEGRNPPVRIIDACDTTVAGGCVCMPTDARSASCSASPSAATTPYCWPYALWHPGDTYTDTANNIRVRVDRAEVAPGFSVTVTRGVPPSRPDVFLIPCLTPPVNTWETVDIWVDSSCNGRERPGARTRRPPPRPPRRRERRGQRGQSLCEP